ncbi:DNA-binding response regulator [Marispirochaeta aestuarii]|uniref:DNA-binding response regulator n=1 Tax=Marispirochaeta aestuarii TaxID=1963862 RepID=A0A1Y1RXE0_9SPIO|nr:helix-turn-helix domain-containing protein [Marispirochaeta aestuarii]ORC35040.1 DNA-binding response regulator [Marispirochaeta aestuarii]
MYKVMIVDDEEPVLESFSYMVETSSDSFSVCGKARTGFEAISMAYNCSPDIVFMDIGMPGIDGLDTIKELQRNHPATLFILSTAYERFDIAKRAIPLKVFDYLVKPISRSRFLETLMKAKQHLDEQTEIAAARLDKARISADSMSWEERNFLLLISWKSLTKREWEKYKLLFSLESDQARVFVFRIEGPEAEALSGIHREIHRKISHKYQILSTEYLGSTLIFLPGDEETRRLQDFLDLVFTQVLPSNAQVQKGLGGQHSYEEFFRSCEEALRALRENDERDTGRHEDWEELGELRSAIARAASFEDIQEPFTSYYEKVFSSSPFPVAKSRIIAFFTLLLDDFYRSLGKKAARYILFDPAAEITPINARKDLDAWIWRSLRTLMEAEHQHMEKNLPAVLTRALYYIQGNYDRPLQLTDVADFCGVSSSYMSRLFTEQLSISFIDYLTSVRLKVAEELLLENRLPIKEIACSVGYQDPNYFSRIFRKQKGFSPSTYLQEHSDEK